MTPVSGPVPPLLRYVVLRHDGIPEPHFDLMFETSPGSLLSTWRSPSWPIEPATPLTPLPAHRRDYLAYEGALTGGRGTVWRVAEGTHWLIDDGAEATIVRLDGTGTVMRLPRASSSICP
jgi:hypothetical protein